MSKRFSTLLPRQTVPATRNRRKMATTTPTATDAETRRLVTAPAIGSGETAAATAPAARRRRRPGARLVAIEVGAEVGAVNIRAATHVATEEATETVTTTAEAVPALALGLRTGTIALALPAGTAMTIAATAAGMMTAAAPEAALETPLRLS